MTQNYAPKPTVSGWYKLIRTSDDGSKAFTGRVLFKTEEPKWVKLSDQFLYLSDMPDALFKGPLVDEEPAATELPTKEPEPLPCPFCGENAVIYKTHGSDGFGIQCSAHQVNAPNFHKCGVSTLGPHGKTIAEVIAVWNRRASISPPSPDVARMLEEIPTNPGYYWAKWRIPAEGTHEGMELCPSDEWEIVQVWANSVDWHNDPMGDEALLVSVPGVRESQGRDCFVWGELVSPMPKVQVVGKAGEPKAGATIPPNDSNVA